MNVLEQLGHLCHAWAADRYHCFDGVGVQSFAELQAAWCCATDNLGDLRGAVLRIARIFALRRVDECAVVARREAGALQARRQNLLGCAGPGGAFKAHQLTRAQVRQDAVDGSLDKAEIWLVMAVEWRGHADDLRVHLGAARKVAGCLEAGLTDARDGVGLDALDVAEVAV